METGSVIANRKRTEITVETHSITTIRTSAGSFDLVECSQCSREVRRISHAAASAIFSVTHEDIGRLAELGAFHLLDEESLCSLSLIGYFAADVRFIEDGLKGGQG